MITFSVLVFFWLGLVAFIWFSFNGRFKSIKGDDLGCLIMIALIALFLTSLAIIKHAEVLDKVLLK